MSTSRLFVPLNDVSSVVVHEGLSGWEMRLYLAIIRKRGAGIVVIFDVRNVGRPWLSFCGFARLTMSVADEAASAASH